MKHAKQNSGKTLGFSSNPPQALPTSGPQNQTLLPLPTERTTHTPTLSSDYLAGTGVVLLNSAQG